MTIGTDIGRQRRRLSGDGALEVALTAAFAVFTLVVSAAYGLPFALPGAESASAVGLHYLYPLIGVAIWALLVAFHGKQPLGATFLLALPCYGLILICHFNLKLWIVHLNPALWDAAYWRIDQTLLPLVEGAKAMRLALAPVIPLGSNFYMFGFIAMFYLAFAWHALQSRAIFRELIVSAMLLQILGSLAYLVAPALGPFLYEPGVEPPVSGAQAYMLEAWHANRDGGAAWLRDHGSGSLTVGLAAMPSLHAGGSFLFVIFAWRHARPLLAVMLPLFAYILVAAVATRWHYVVDLPVGIALAWCAAALARRLLRAETARAGAVAEQPSPTPVPPGLPAPAE